MKAEEIVAKVKNLPPVSHTALQLVNMLDQPAMSNNDVVEVLKYDNVLTAKLLRACNSPFFGLEETVSSVEQAVLILGHQQILHLVLSIAFNGVMVAPLPGYAEEACDLWRHSLGTALAGETIAKLGIPMPYEVEPPVAFTAGLLHDIGKLVLSHVITPQFHIAIRARMEHEGLNRAQAEMDILGADHAQVGGHLLRTWHLPDDIVEAVVQHQDPLPRTGKALPSVVHVANQLAHQIETTVDWDQFIAHTSATAVEILEITPARFEELIAAIMESKEDLDQLATLA